MKQTMKYDIKQLLFFFYGIALATLFAWCLVQGVLLHYAGMPFSAAIYYFLGMFSLGALISTYVQARKHKLD